MMELKQINIKNRTSYFYNGMVNLKNFEPNLLKIDKNIIKRLIFTISDTLELKRLMIMKVFTAKILCTGRLIMQTDILKKKMEINT